MKRFIQLVSILFVSVSVGSCVSAKQRAEEQQELEKSIRTSSDPDAVKGCSFVMNLRPDGLHSTPEAQAASLVIPKQGVSWVVLGGSGGHELYSCSRKTPQDVQPAAALTPTPVETKPEAETSAPVEAKAAPVQPKPKPEVATRERSEAEIAGPAPTKEPASKTRITNNPEAVKGCKFVASFAEYRKVSRFQEDVVRVGGNLGYVVASNLDGDVIGESYLCPAEAVP